MEEQEKIKPKKNTDKSCLEKIMNETDKHKKNALSVYSARRRS